MNFRDQEVHLA